MSLRTSRNFRKALTVFAAIAFVGGCAANRPAPAPQGQPAQEQSGERTQSGAQSHILMYWDKIDGGIEGNAFTGTRSIQFVRPVAVAAQDNFVFIYDAGTYHLYRYDMAMKDLKLVKDLQSLVSGDVDSIYVTPNLSFYVADTYGGRVLYFDPRGNLIRSYGDTLNLVRPVSVKLDESRDTLLVADGLNDFILEFDPLGNVRRAVGSRGEEPGQFINITAMTLHRHKVYVTSRLGRRVQVLNESGHFQQQIDSTIRFPTAVAVDDQDRIYIADYLDNTIKIYSGDGKLLDTAGGTGVGPGRFKRITSLWIEQGFLYAADSLNGRVQIMRIAH